MLFMVDTQYRDSLKRFDALQKVLDGGWLLLSSERVRMAPVEEHVYVLKIQDHILLGRCVERLAEAALRLYATLADEGRHIKLMDVGHNAVGQVRQRLLVLHSLASCEYDSYPLAVFITLDKILERCLVRVLLVRNGNNLIGRTGTGVCGHGREAVDAGGAEVSRQQSFAGLHMYRVPIIMITVVRYFFMPPFGQKRTCPVLACTLHGSCNPIDADEQRIAKSVTAGCISVAVALQELDLQ